MMKARACIDGIRPYSPGKPIEEVQRELGIEQVFKLASNENPLGPPASAVDAIGVAALKGSLYPDANAYELRMALAEKHDVDPSELMFGDGSNELIKLLSLCYLNPGDEIIAPHPSFGEYMRTATVSDAAVKLIPLTDGYANDLPALAAAISTRTKIIYICNPNNPTGTVINDMQLRQFMHRVGKDILVVLDEAYFEYVDDPHSPDGVEFYKRYPNVVALRTFSKAFGLAGLRVGYGVAHPDVVTAVNKVREPFNVNLIAQAAALAALQDKEYLTKSVEFNRVERAYVTKELEAMGVDVVKSQSNFVLVDVGTDCVALFKELLKKGIIVRTGDIFGYPTKLRVSIGLREENIRFLAALKELLPQKEAKEEAVTETEAALEAEAETETVAPDEETAAQSVEQG